MNRIAPQAVLEIRSVPGLAGKVRIPAPVGLTHLQFRRFAGCPVCNLHLRSFAEAKHTLDAAGVREIIVFHSSKDAVRKYEKDIPFDVIPDPQKRLYAAFNVEAGARALIDPRSWKAILLGVFKSATEIVRNGAPLPPIGPGGGSFGLPADFLLDPDGVVLACKYGQHAYDQWTVDEVLTLAST
jgi:hypothetical protein